MGSSISQIQLSQGNNPVNPQPTNANYSPAQQQMGGKIGPVGRADNAPTPQIYAPQEPYFNSGYPMPDYPENSQPSGKGQKTMYSPISRQPRYGQPNPYPNTIGQWDNASIQPRQGFGKGKGG